MFADPKKRDLRRLKRRLKAGASIVVAVAAGTFLAFCRGAGGPVGSNPGGPDARGGKDAELDAPDASSTAIQVYSPDAGQPAVDIEQHRKGMPVDDNLLE